MNLSTDSQDAERTQSQISKQSDLLEHVTEQIGIDKLKNLIGNNILNIDRREDLYNIEFLNDFEIKELRLFQCKNIVLKLNNHRIKTLELDSCQIYSSDDLQLPNLESLQVFNSKFDNDQLFSQNIGKFKNLQESQVLVELVKTSYRYNQITQGQLNAIQEILNS
ncbi:Hypothetical_protein [Hexamita inflata]|uniref:Hypothetical_protein n=1 Tax=Hexamita inflata TaxID=28002 RepID=A0AA86NHT9_9EUKA|nr:Hypothetical protein HINF_LOCUS7357 [Hexamita inflata]